MENVVLVVHLILALCLIGVVLLQRSEGGGLGMGGGGATTGRPPVTGLGKLTWVFAAGFFTTSVTLTVLAAQNSADSSVLDGVAIEEVDTEIPELGDALLPPSVGDGPLLPPAVD